MKSKAYREYGCSYPKPNHAEQDAALILKLTFEACKEAVEKSGINPKNIISAGLSTQRACGIFIDKDGNPMKMFSWQDCRAEDEMREISEKISAKEFYEITGIPINPAWLLPKMMWVEKHEPEIWNKTFKVIQLYDYILKALGADDYYIPETDAGWYCVWDINKMKWNEGLIKKFDVDISKFSKVLPSCSEVGKISKKISEITALPENLPIIIGAGDQTCACIGAGVVKPGALSVSMGTGGMCLGFLDKPYRDPRASFMVVNHAIHGCWELEGWQKGSAGIFRWFRDEIATMEKNTAKQSNKNAYELLDELAGNTPAGSKGLVVLPYFTSAGTPRWNDDARGTIFGLTYSHDRGCLTRSFMEGITMEHRDMMESLKQSGVQVSRVCIIGGPTKSEIWNQIQADIYGVPVEKPVYSDASIVGAAITGVVGIGLYKNIPEAVDDLVKIEKVYEPIPKNVEVYNEIYNVYVKTYEGLNNNGAFKAIADLQKNIIS